MNEVEHFFDVEIEQAKERIENDDAIFFNDVKVGMTTGKKLNENHITFCENAKEELAGAIENRDNQIKELKHRVDCLEADKENLRTRCKESARDNFDNHLYGLLNIVGVEELHSKLELPSEPIKVAEMLIDAQGTYETSSISRAFGAGEIEAYNLYSKSDLRQIAEHLLVYCNNAENGD